MISVNFFLRSLQSDLWPSHRQRSPASFPGQQESGAPNLRAPAGPRRQVALRSHVAGVVFPELKWRSALLGAGGVQTVGLFRRDVPEHPAQREGQMLHGGHERAVVEPAAWRTSIERVARRMQGACRRSAAAEHAAAAHRDASGLRGRNAHLLRGRRASARLPLRIYTRAVSSVLDWGRRHRYALRALSQKIVVVLWPPFLLNLSCRGEICLGRIM